MAAELKDTFFTQYGQYFSTSHLKNMAAMPFKDHPQFPILVDILSRKDLHHAHLFAEFSSAMQITFLEALLQHLTQPHVTPHLRGSDLHYLNLENATLTEIKQLAIEKDFELLCDKLNTSDKYLLVALTRTELFSKEPKKADERFLRRQIDLLLAHPKCRVLLMTSAKEHHLYTHLEDQFAPLFITGPTDTDAMTSLKQHKLSLEAFHQVSIPNELLNEALLLSERYLSNTHALEKTLLLLDSSAARASATDPGILTPSILLDVLSDWTQIPASHLQVNQFKHTDFTQGLLQRVFGQETAVAMLGHELLQAQAYLQQKNGPFSSFLFAGPPHCGKKTTAIALVEQLFKQLNVLYFAQPALGQHCLSEMKLQRCLDKQFLTLANVIRQTPYAVILFENIETLAPNILNSLQEILTTGFLHDVHGNQYNFKQAIIILSTTIGTNSLAEFTETSIHDDDLYTMDLMQLVLNDPKNESQRPSHHHSPQEIVEKIMPAITEAFPLPLCQHTFLVPFLPLNKAAVEKIIRLKLKVLGKQLETRYNIELGYAPEVIRFLTNETLIKRDQDDPIINPDTALKQLYFCVEQAILNQAENNKSRSNQLCLQLNETGHLLRCDWLPVPARQHA